MPTEKREGGVRDHPLKGLSLQNDGGQAQRKNIPSFKKINETYLMQLSFYIHRNPLRAGIVKRLADYKWSSYRAFAYGYITWQLGVATNQQIGEKFGLTYSAVSQRVGVIKKMLNNDKELERKYQRIKSLIKI